jgi:DNA-binding HxlR family transcriptional regulator
LQETLAERDSVRLLGRKWALPVLLQIMSGKTRFNSILKEVRGINARTLSERLDQYEACGLIQKTNGTRHALETGYRLTKKGEEMRHIIIAVSGFSLKWHNDSGLEGTA